MVVMDPLTRGPLGHVDTFAKRVVARLGDGGVPGARKPCAVTVAGDVESMPAAEAERLLNDRRGIER